MIPAEAALVFGLDADAAGVKAGLWVECVGATGAVVFGVCATDEIVGEGAVVANEVCGVVVVLDGVAADEVGEELDAGDVRFALVFALCELLDPHAVIDMALMAITAEMTLLRIVRSFVVLDAAMTQITSYRFPIS